MQQIGPYVLSRRIGAGGMAEVWLAQRATLGASKTLAVKLLAPNLACKAQYRQLFFEEARLSMLLNHSNIVQVFDFGEEQGECYIAMEWIDGANLAELQAALWGCGRSMPIGVAMYITGELLRALEYAHNMVHDGAASIVHRDVSPSNIMVSLAGEVKLTDFGVARFGTEETSGVHVKGKLRYMAPEQLRGNSKAGTVDIFSVGAVLHEMIDGLKFRGSNADEAQLIGAICEGRIPELNDPTRISAPLEALRRSMLAAELERRIPSARAALRALRRCPGYRHAAHELETLVGWYRRAEPRHWGYRPMQLGPGQSGVSGRSPNERSGSGSRFGSSSEAARLAPSARVPEATDQRRRAAAITLALGGLCIGCLGMGFAVSSFEHELDFDGPGEATGGERAPAPAPIEAVARPTPALVRTVSLDAEAAIASTAAPTSVEVPPAESIGDESPESEPEPKPVPKPEPKPKPEPEPAARSNSKPAPAAQSEPVPAAQSKPAPSPPAPAKRSHEPVEVKFAAGTFKFAYLKVGNKRLLIEPDGKLALPPGTHKVYARFAADDQWRYFGKLHIRPKQAYRVKLVEPGELDVNLQE